MMAYNFRKAKLSDQDQIWEILQQGIRRRKEEGSSQWQDGYPNLNVVTKDIDAGIGYVLTEDTKIIGYSAMAINDEPEYARIQGKWITDNDFIVFHRLAISEDRVGKNLSVMIISYIEEFARSNNIFSIKADTNFDNTAMLKIFKKLNFKYCGEVTFRGNARQAFEKVLSNKEK